MYPEGGSHVKFPPILGAGFSGVPGHSNQELPVYSCAVPAGFWILDEV